MLTFTITCANLKAITELGQRTITSRLKERRLLNLDKELHADYALLQEYLDIAENASSDITVTNREFRAIMKAARLAN